MPLYVFKHPEEEVVVEIIQKMEETHVFVDDEGTEWERVWDTPNTSVDTNQLDGSKESFMKYTENRKGTLGDLWDASRECSEKRIQRDGKDHVKEKFFKEYKEKNNVKHMKDNG